ncbi:MAG TPA: sarcosine oxidase subunit gamma family protein [Povalibacter sp.]|nr:sarcosine oxidase subunit gamma family protein [Povalibacter sp.]
MADHSVTLMPRAPFADLPDWPPMPVAGCGVVVEDRDGLGIATVQARKDRVSDLARRLRERFSIELPVGAVRTTSGNVALAGIGPGAWLATCESGANGFAHGLKEGLAGLASVSDQSGGYAVLRLSGPNVRDTLYKLVPVDLHPRIFPVGGVAVTVAAHMGVTLWRLRDDANDLPVFEMAVYRSFAADFWQTLRTSASAFGVAAVCRIVTGRAEHDSRLDTLTGKDDPVSPCSLSLQESS